MAKFQGSASEEGFRWCLEPCCQVSFDRLWLVAWRVALQYRAVCAHEEFRKVPLDRLGAENPRLLRFDVCVRRETVPDTVSWL